MNNLNMKKICFLSCQSLEGHAPDEDLAIDELHQSGKYQVSTIPWDNEADWASFDLVIVRTTWDYHKRPVEFVKKLRSIATQTKLMNSAEVVEWNFHKKYLMELEASGVKIVPTKMFVLPGKITVPEHWKCERFIVKPAISATAYKTFICTKQDLNDSGFLSQLHPGDWILQPFLEIIKKGEISLHFFNKKYSHAIIKIPKAGDFRVQEEHGGDIQPFTPSGELLTQSAELVRKVPFDLLYARVDVVPFEGEHLLMEIELIEPALYFRTSSESVKNFRLAIDKIFKE